MQPKESADDCLTAMGAAQADQLRLCRRQPTSCMHNLRVDHTVPFVVWATASQYEAQQLEKTGLTCRWVWKLTLCSVICLTPHGDATMLATSQSERQGAATSSSAGCTASTGYQLLLRTAGNLLMPCWQATPTDVQEKGQLRTIAWCMLLQSLCLDSLRCTFWLATDSKTPWARRRKRQSV